MKLIHLSDLHLGRRVNGYSLLEDQAHILGQILEIIDREGPDGVILAGDLYDKPVPPAEAVGLFDRFLTALSGRGVPVYLLSGNHDSPERVAFAGRILAAGGVHVAPVYDGAVRPLRLTDRYGPVFLYLLPFVKPAHVRAFYPEAGIAAFTDALACAIAHMDVDPAARNVLATHQFVTGAVRAESEEISVGGADNVDVRVFDPFDYVALGHLHRPQHCGRQTVRYCGSPLKYSFSEARDRKSVTVVELGEKGRVDVRAVPLTPLRDMVELRGTYAELTQRSYYMNTSWQEDYVHITLTDEEDIPDAVGKLRAVYHRLMKLEYDNRRTRGRAVVTGAAGPETGSPAALFAAFYELQNNRPMSPEQAAFIQGLTETVWEEGREA